MLLRVVTLCYTYISTMNFTAFTIQRFVEQILQVALDAEAVVLVSTRAAAAG